MARIGITLSEELNEKFCALAELDGTKPSTLAVEVIKAYMDTRKVDVDNALRVRADYEKNIAELRKKKKAQAS